MATTASEIIKNNSSVTKYLFIDCDNNHGEAEQDWDEEITTYTFPDESKLWVQGNCFGEGEGPEGE